MRGWFGLLQLIAVDIDTFRGVIFIVHHTGVASYAVTPSSTKNRSSFPVIVILAIVFIGGLVIAQTPFHRTIMLSARSGGLPPAFTGVYGHPLRTPPPPDMYHGQIASLIPGGFVLSDEDNGTTTVILTPDTRLPYGENFLRWASASWWSGMRSTTGMVQAFGVREIDEYPAQ